MAECQLSFRVLFQDSLYYLSRGWKEIFQRYGLLITKELQLQDGVCTKAKDGPFRWRSLRLGIRIEERISKDKQNQGLLDKLGERMPSCDSMQTIDKWLT